MISVMKILTAQTLWVLRLSGGRGARVSKHFQLKSMPCSKFFVQTQCVIVINVGVDAWTVLLQLPLVRPQGIALINDPALLCDCCTCSDGQLPRCPDGSFPFVPTAEPEACDMNSISSIFEHITDNCCEGFDCSDGRRLQMQGAGRAASQLAARQVLTRGFALAAR